MVSHSKSVRTLTSAGAVVLLAAMLPVAGCKKSPPAPATPQNVSAPTPSTAPAPVVPAPEMKVPEEPVPPPAAPPAAASTAPKGAVQHKLIWVRKDEPDQLYEVLSTQPFQTNVSPDAFKRWCTPFDVASYTVHQKREVAKDGIFQEEPNWWAKPPYLLPNLSDSWLRIMGQDSWFYYEVEPR